MVFFPTSLGGPDDRRGQSHRVTGRAEGARAPAGVVVVGKDGQDLSVCELQGVRGVHELIHCPTEENESMVPIPGSTVVTTENRFDSVVINLQTTAENLSASQSRIRDADFAEETATLARAQVLQQAGIAVLAQANAQPQNVLALLQ